MKKINLLAIVIILLCAVIPAKALDKYSIDRNDLPEISRQFLTEHFPKARVSMVKVDKHLLKKTDYDVKLTNGTKIEFNNSGNWTSVDCKTREVPSALIIKPIQNYVKKNFPETHVVKIEKKVTEYEIELSDGIELKFDRLGKFKSMKLDD